VARPARAVRAAADRLRPLLALAPRRHLRPPPRSAAPPAGRGGHDRPGHLVRRRHVDPGEPLGRRRAKKAAEGEPEDHALGRSRGGFTTKLHLLTDANGLPLAVHSTAGQRHESRAFEPLMASVRLPRRRGRPRTRPERPLGDRAYSTPAIREHCRRRGVKAVIPQRADELRRRRRGRPLAFDPTAYRKRNAAERCVGWLKECRGLGTRFEKLAVSSLAAVKLACVRLPLRRLRPSDRA
jgi:transposase